MEALTEYYSDNLAEETFRGMRESALRGTFLGANAPFGYRKARKPGSDGRVRITLEVVPEEADTLRYIFQCSLDGQGVKEIGKDLTAQGITNRGKRWINSSLHRLLTNEATVGTLVWGKRRKRGAADPVRVEDAWPAIVSREIFDQVQAGLVLRSPVKGPRRQRPVFLLDDFLVCGRCDRKYIVQGAKNNRYFYYVCSTLHQQGAGTCQASYLNTAVTDREFIDQLTDQLSCPPALPSITDLAKGPASSAMNRLSHLVDQAKATLDGIEQDVSGSSILNLLRSLPSENTLSELTFVRDCLENLTDLRKEIARSRRRVDNIAGHFGPHGGGHNLAASVEQFRQRLIGDSPLQKRETIALLVERVVVVGRGQLDIEAKLPFSS